MAEQPVRIWDIYERCWKLRDARIQRGDHDLDEADLERVMKGLTEHEKEFMRHMVNFAIVIFGDNPPERPQ